MMFTLADAGMLAGSAGEGGDASAGAYVMLAFYLTLALGVSFLCSMLEAGLLAIPGSHVAVLKREGGRTGAMLDEMKRNIDRPLAAILTLNTVAHTIGAAGVGAQILIIWGDRWLAIGSIIVTLLILIGSEIIPKTLGAVHAKRLAWFTSRTTQLLIWITYPLVVVLELISKLFGGGHGEMVTREEVAVVAELGEAAGELKAHETAVIANLLRLRDIPVEDVCTPRAVVFMLPANESIHDALLRKRVQQFSRIPVFGDSPDDIRGMVTRRELNLAVRENRGEQPVSSITDPVHSVKEDASVAEVLDAFIERNEHLFMVVDTFGGTTGLVTLEDAIETLLGVEIVDETDSAADMRAVARKLSEKRRTERAEGYAPTADEPVETRSDGR